MADDLARLLEPGYVSNLHDRSLDEIRAMRAECQRHEAALSYFRRLVQGRLDIVGADRRRRQLGHGPSDVSDLIELLPQVLGEHVTAPGPGRPPSPLVPPDDDALTSELDDVVDVAALGSLADLDDAELDALVERLTALERSVSERRRSLHERIDALQAELARRYGTGEASVETLLR